MKKKLMITITCEADVESEEELDELTCLLADEVSNALDEMSSILRRDEVKQLYSDGVEISPENETEATPSLAA